MSRRRMIRQDIVQGQFAETSVGYGEVAGRAINTCGKHAASEATFLVLPRTGRQDCASEDCPMKNAWGDSISP